MGGIPGAVDDDVADCATRTPHHMAQNMTQFYDDMDNMEYGWCKRAKVHHTCGSVCEFMRYIQVCVLFIRASIFHISFFFSSIFARLPNVCFFSCCSQARSHFRVQLRNIQMPWELLAVIILHTHTHHTNLHSSL